MLLWVWCLLHNVVGRKVKCMSEWTGLYDDVPREGCFRKMHYSAIRAAQGQLFMRGGYSILPIFLPAVFMVKQDTQ